MSAFIGNVKGPHHNSPDDAAEVWCSPNAVEFTLYDGISMPKSPTGVTRTLDPVGARNLAALLVRASEEAERMAARRERNAHDDKTPMSGG